MASIPEGKQKLRQAYYVSHCAKYFKIELFHRILKKFQRGLVICSRLHT